MKYVSTHVVKVGHQLDCFSTRLHIEEILHALHQRRQSLICNAHFITSEREILVRLYIVESLRVA